MAFKSLWRSLKNLKKVPLQQDALLLGITCTTQGNSLSEKNWGDPKKEKTTNVNVNLGMSCIFCIITGEFGGIGIVA